MTHAPSFFTQGGGAVAPSQMFDSLLEEMAEGRAELAMAMLLGMLDAAYHGGRFAEWSAALDRHAIRPFIDANPANPAPLGAQAVLAHLGFARGWAARRALFGHCLSTGIGAGRCIALIAPADWAAEGEAEEAADGTAQAALSHYADWRDLCDAARPGAGFDQILAPMLPDALAPAKLGSAITALTALLTDGGMLTLSAFAPTPLGLGWKAAMRQTMPHCYDEAALEALVQGEEAGQASRLSLHHRRDASNSLIWADVRIRATATHKGGRP